MASHETFVPLQQEPKFRVRRPSLRSRTDDGTHDRKKEDLLALPPVRALATTSQENQTDGLQTPLNKWQIHRCATPNTTPCQEELVNEWLHRNHIQVVDRLPKMDPVVLTSRGTDVSKYISFIHPPPFSLKLLSGSTEEQKYREKRNKLAQAPSSTSGSPCPRLLRNQRSDRETFALNPVIRVGGGYRRLSWKVLDVLPSIGQYDPDVDPVYSCASCHANLQVVGKVTNSRGRVHSIFTTPKQCHKCGAPTTDSQIHTEKDLHESVIDTLHRGDSRFIVDHRRFKKSGVEQPSSRVNPEDLHFNSPMDWRDDLESFRLHMSRQSQTEDDLETTTQRYERNRSESGSSSVFMTEPGANIDNLNEPPDIRRAWDDGVTRATILRDDENDNGEWEKGKENGERNGKENRSSATDNDLDAYSDFEMIEDYDPKSGFTVRLRRKPFGGGRKTSYFIRGIRDEEGSSERSLDKGGKSHEHGRKKVHRNKQEIQTDTQINKSTPNKRNKQALAQKKRGKGFSHNLNESERRLEYETNQTAKYDENPLLRKNSSSGEQRRDETNQRTRHHKNPLSRTDSFFVVGLDQRDKVFSTTPVAEELSDDEDDDDDVIIFTKTRFSEDSLSDLEFKEDDAWSPDSPSSGLFRPKIPSPGNFGNQDDMDRPSSWSVSPTQHDGYLADSEENVDLSSLQAQIQQARNNAMKTERRKDESQETMRRESKENSAKDEHIAATEDSPSQRPLENDFSDRAPLKSTEWDSDWDSDFSLHVKPLSDLSASSSDESQWEPRNQTRPANNESRVRKRSDKTVTNAARRKESKLGTTEQRKGSEIERTLEGGTRRSIGGEDYPRERRDKRPTVKPIPKIGQDSDSDEVHFRPRPRAFRGDDELSESDMNFFKQQFQAPNSSRDHNKGISQESPVGCKGINCYRCSSFIPECEGICSMCGTLCQRSGGPCKACRDICERCGKPRYKCSSANERLETSDEEREGKEEHFDAEATETGPGIPAQRTSPFRGHINSPASASAEELNREESLIMIGEEVSDSDKSIKKSKERKIRAPPERKSKDPNSIKRVRKKRYRTVDDEDNEMPEEKEVIEEEENGDDRPQSAEPTQVSSDEVIPAKPQPSAFAAKGTKKTKPSKKIISQTVVYKEKEKPPMSIQGYSPEREEINEDDSVVTSSTPLVETVEPGEDLSIENNGEGTGEEMQMKEETVEGDGTNDDVSEDRKDVSSKGEEEPRANNEELEEEKEKEEEKEEEKQIEKETRTAPPKIRGVSRVNAAFKERAELGKRLQKVLKEAVSEVMGQADIKTRKDSTIDYIAQYRLVDRSRLEMYGRAFTLEDEDEDGIISYEQMMLALEGVSSIAGMSRKQLLFVLQVLELFPGSRITFKMFSVATALCEKVTILDAFVKQLVEELDLFELECKLDMFRNMFFVTGDFSVTYITADQLRIELKAGGLNQNQEDHVIRHILQSSDTGEISFLDYMAYLPLFLSIHQNICDNALDMSRNKYQRHSTT